MRYVVVARNPDEALASMHPFIHAHSDAWFDLWKLPREAFCRPDFASFYHEVAKAMFPRMLFGFVAGVVAAAARRQRAAACTSRT